MRREAEGGVREGGVLDWAARRREAERRERGCGN